jgi:hypothetical protein
MSIIRAAVKLIIREHAHFAFRGAGLTLGVPDVQASYAELRAWFPELAGQPCPLAPEDVELSNKTLSKEMRHVSGRTFLRSLGLSRIDSLDIPGSEHPAELLHDLNTPLPDQLRGRYSFLLDPGTLEHVFDVATCLRNIAQFLAVDGVVVHFVPVYSYNGGYYSINPNVLHDFYRANGFTDLRAYVIMWDRYRAHSKAKTLCYTYGEEILGCRHAVADRDQVRHAPHLLLFARKDRDVDSFVSPLQSGGDYAGQAAAAKRPGAQGLERFGSRWAPVVDRILPISVSFYLQQWVYRELVLLRARRKASFRI